MFGLRIFLVFILMVSLSNAAEIHLLNNAKYQGEIVSIDPKGVLFKLKEGDKLFTNNEILSVDTGSTSKDVSGLKTIEVELTDGTTFRCSEFKIKGQKALLKLFTEDGKGRVLELPTTSIYTMLREAQDALNTLEFKKVINQLRKERRDILVLAKGEGANRQLNGIPCTIGEGMLDPEGDKLKFTSGQSEEKNLFQDRIHGMMFSQIPTGERPATICRVIDSQKNILFAQAISLRDKSVSVKTVGGLDIEFPSLQSITRFDYSTSTLKFLSDLPPATVVRTDNSEAPFSAPTFDKNLDGEPMKIGGIGYPKGVAIHSGYAITWNINADYRGLKGLFGVDDAFDVQSAVQVTIEGDGRELFKKVIKKKDKPMDVNLDVSNVKLLKVIVQSEDPNGFDFENQINFADAKVTK
jgi:hypothetical protein